MRARMLGGALLALLTVTAVAACGGERAAPDGPSVSVTTVTTESRTEIDAAVGVCRQSITSAAVMVRDYNAFVARLNQTHDYRRIDTEDRYARDTLDTGADLIRQALTPDVPDDLAARVHDFLTATEQLSEQIGQRHKLALNKAMDDWGARRTELLDACGEFLPTGVN